MRYADQLYSRRLSSSRASTPREWQGISAEDTDASDDRAYYFSHAAPHATVRTPRSDPARRGPLRYLPQRAAWNSSVRMDSPSGRATSTLGEVSGKSSRNYGHTESETRRGRVTRRLASSLENGDRGRGPAGERQPYKGRGPPYRQPGRPLAGHPLDEYDYTAADAWGPARDGDVHYASTPPPLPRRPRDHRAAEADEAAAPLGTAAVETDGGAQARLYSELQRVVVELSATALRQRRGAVDAERRLQSYGALVREQNVLIEQLRHESARAVRERDALVAFRRRSLVRPAEDRVAARGGVGPERSLIAATGARGPTDEELDAWLRAEYDRCNHIPPYQYGGLGGAGPGQRPYPHPVDELSPDARVLLRSLAAQLHSERSNRLDVEEQSSRMIGEQQLALERLETRMLRAREPHVASAGPPRSPRGAHMDPMVDDGPTVSSPSSCASSSPTAAARRQTAVGHDDSHGIVDSRQHSHSSNGRQGSRPPLPPAVSGGGWVMPLLGRQSPSPMSTPRGMVVFQGTGSTPDRFGIPPGSAAYEDAEAILDDIRRRYNLF